MIRCENLTRDFGKTRCVDSLTFELEPGDIYGFIGRNGAGKTTTFRMLATLLEPTDGEAWVGGHSILDDPEQVRRVLGYMPDQFGNFDGLTSQEYLEFFASAHGLDRKRREAVIDELLALTELEGKRAALVETLSFGTKQRLTLAKTLLHDPPVLVLDEPASGLDPLARLRLRKLLQRLAKGGKTLILSSHILSDLAEICTKVGILEAGKLLSHGPIGQLQLAGDGQSRTLQLQLNGPPDRARPHLESWVFAQQLEWREPFWEITTACALEDQCQLILRLMQEGLVPVHLSEKGRSLDSVFSDALESA